MRPHQHTHMSPIGRQVDHLGCECIVERIEVQARQRPRPRRARAQVGGPAVGTWGAEMLLVVMVLLHLLLLLLLVLVIILMRVHSF